MAKKTIVDSLQKITERVLERNDVPLSNIEASVTADKVAAAIAPVVANATNTEPWYKSRIYLGLLAAGAGIGLSRFGISISGDDLKAIIDNVELVVTGGGVLFALYGRIFGNRLRPLFTKKV